MLFDMEYVDILFGMGYCLLVLVGIVVNFLFKFV